MLNLVKIVFSCHTIKHNGRGFFSRIYAPERTLRKDPASFISWMLDARENPCPSFSGIWDSLSALIPFALKLLLFCFASPSALVGIPLCPLLSALFQQHKGSRLVCATEATALHKNRSTVSLTQEITTSFQLVRNSSVQAVQLLELMKCSSTSATGHSQCQVYAWWKIP